MGQKLSPDDTDDQTACAFRASHPAARSLEFAALQSDLSEFRTEAVGLG